MSPIKKNSKKIPNIAGGGNEKIPIFVDYIYYTYKLLKAVKRRCALCKPIHPNEETKDEYNINHFLRMRKFLLLLVLCLGSVGATFAQIKISGKVVDAETGQPLIGATVMIGTTTGVATLADGTGADVHLHRL